MSTFRQAVKELRTYSAHSARGLEEDARFASMDDLDPGDEPGQAKAYEDIVKRLDEILRDHP